MIIPIFYRETYRDEDRRVIELAIPTMPGRYLLSWTSKTITFDYNHYVIYDNVKFYCLDIQWSEGDVYTIQQAAIQGENTNLINDTPEYFLIPMNEDKEINGYSYHYKSEIEIEVE